MTKAEIQRRYNEILDAQRRFLDRDVPARLKTEPAWDFRADADYQRRQRELADLELQLRSGRFDGGSGAGREFTHSSLTPEEAFRRGLNPSQATHDTHDRQYSDEETEQLRAFGALLAGGEVALERAHPGVLTRASLSTASGSVGGYLVPTFVQSMVIQDLTKFQTVRRLGASTRTLIGKENLPMVNDPTAAFITEADVISSGMSQTDPTFQQVEIRPELVYATTNFGWHVQQFSPADVEQEIRKSFGRAIAKTTAQKYLTGTGTNQPQGVVTGAAIGVTAAAVDEFTAEEINQLWYSLDPWYQLDAAWIIRAEAATLLRTLESTNGSPLWVRDLASGADTLFGRPVVIDPFMPAMTAGLRPIVVGSMAEAYIIAESQIFVVVDPYSRHRHAENIVTMYQFVDGRTRRSSAIKALEMASGL